MRFLIISNAPFIYHGKTAVAYTPYIKEMAIWQENATETAFCCPVWNDENGLLVSEIPFKFRHFRLKDFNLNSPKAVLYALFYLPYNIIVLFRAMWWADHIHLRCPGNVGLLGAVLQVFFPHKKKTAKYAGNWDPSISKPWSYRLQQCILGNTFLTHNIKVLVYGKWPGMSKNIKPFFTASYSENEAKVSSKDDFQGPIRLIFAGMLTPGKGVMYALKVVNELHKKGHQIRLALYGEGPEREAIHGYIEESKLEHIVKVHGNQDEAVLKAAYQQSHFVLLPSASEGWPKVIAEGMFWGCVPIATAVSCVPDMLDSGKRGLLLTMNIGSDLPKIENLITDYPGFLLKSRKSADWSRYFTRELFEEEIKKLVQT